MIVKDEAAVITRAFDSVREIVDSYIICDTGSTDGTQEVIKSYWKENNLKGELHEHEWINFGRNRTQCFELAKGKSDYIMTLDADEVIAPFKAGEAVLDHKVVELPVLTADMISCTTVLGTNRYQRAQFFRNGIDWKWSEPVHEVCGSEEQTEKSYLADLCCFASTGDGDRSKEGAIKFKRDAALFEAHLVDNPENPRSWFYLAQTYGDAGEYERAIAAADTALKYLWWDQEIFITHLRKARWKMALGKTIQEVTYDYLKAYSVDPRRLEPLHDLILHYSREQEYHLSEIFVALGRMLKYPAKESLFIEREVYTWRFKDLVSVAAYWVDSHQECVNLCKELLEEGYLPENQKLRVEANLKGAYKKLEKKNQEI